jgi:hypothetical protein
MAVACESPRRLVFADRTRGLDFLFGALKAALAQAEIPVRTSA